MLQTSRLLRQGGTKVGGLIHRSKYAVPFGSRGVYDNRGKGEKGGAEGSKRRKNKDEFSKLFASQNLQGISNLEIERMKVAYNLVKEHAEALEEGRSPPDAEKNPMIDPRSFGLPTLPALPKEVLSSFRQELPAKSASNARIVGTRAVWEEQGVRGLSEDMVSPDDAEWAAVDERTMDARQFSWMRRQSINTADQVAQNMVPFGGTRVKSSRRKCRLSDTRGRVHIDFRQVARLNAFLSEGGKILPRRKTALSAKAQRRVSRAIKTARQMALIAREPRPGPTLEEIREMETSL